MRCLCPSSYFCVHLSSQQSQTLGVGSSHIQRYPAKGITVMHTVAAASLLFILQVRKPPPTYTQSLTAPIMETNMETQILWGYFSCALPWTRFSLLLWRLKPSSSCFCGLQNVAVIRAGLSIQHEGGDGSLTADRDTKGLSISMLACIINKTLKTLYVKLLLLVKMLQ